MKHFVWILCLALTGCAYSFRGTSLGHIKNVHVPVFENQTSEPLIRERITDKIIDQILNDNALKVSARDGADAALLGKIIDINENPFTFEGSNGDFTTNDYKITIVTKVAFQDLVENRKLWEENISGWGRYTLDGSKTREEGIEEALEMISQNVLNKVVSNW